ncbi:MAG: hypothetical protein JNK63_02610 [Chthonomonas sp.]|nr:hypothetical protein [Chthonomonas sp.]
MVWLDLFLIGFVAALGFGLCMMPRPKKYPWLIILMIFPAWLAGTKTYLILMGLMVSNKPYVNMFMEWPLTIGAGGVCGIIAARFILAKAAVTKAYKEVAPEPIQPLQG